MQESFKYEARDAGIRNLYIQSVVMIGGIPVAGFLSAIDVESFLKSLSDFDLGDSRVVCTMLNNTQYGESLTGKEYIEERESTKVWAL